MVFALRLRATGSIFMNTAVRTTSLSAFEQADGLRGETRSFGQVLLGNVGRVAAAPE